MRTEVYVYLALGILAMIINISFLIVTLLVQKARKSAKRKKGVFKMMYITLLSSNCAMLLDPVIRYWASQLEVHSEIWCILISYVSWTSCSVNVCSILLISIDRFLAVMNPFRYVQLMKAGKVIGLQIVFMAWSFIMPQVAGSKRKNKRYEYIRQLNFCVPTDNKILFHAWYLVSYIFPAIVAVSLNGFIMRYLFRRLSVFTDRIETRRQIVENRSRTSLTGGSTAGKPSQDSFTFSKLSDNAWRRRFSVAWGDFAFNVEDSTVLMKRRVSRIYERSCSQKTFALSPVPLNGRPENCQKNEKDQEGELESMIMGRKNSRGSQYISTAANTGSVNKNGSSQDSEIRPTKITRELTYEGERLQLQADGETRRSPSCCISYSGGDEISSSPISPIFLNINPPNGAGGTPHSPGTKSEKCVRRQFDIILKTITGCVTEFVLFTLAWTAVYVVTAILRVEKFPIHAIMITLIHTIVTSVLYSASYTSYYNKALRAKSRYGKQNY